MKKKRKKKQHAKSIGIWRMAGMGPVWRMWPEENVFFCVLFNSVVICSAVGWLVTTKRIAFNVDNEMDNEWQMIARRVDISLGPQLREKEEN